MGLQDVREEGRVNWSTAPRAGQHVVTLEDRDADLRRHRHRRRPQRPHLRSLSRPRRLAGQSGRAPRGRGRRGGDGGILSRFPQFGRRLYREPAQSEGHRRSCAGAARAQNRRAPRAEFRAGAGRPLPPRRRRPHAAGAGEVLRPRTPNATPPSTARSTPSPTCCAAWCCSRRRTSPRVFRGAASANSSARSASPTACAICRWRRAARCSTSSPNPPRIIWMAGSRANSSKPCSASTPWSATTRAPIRPAPPT